MLCFSFWVLPTVLGLGLHSHHLCLLSHSILEGHQSLDLGPTLILCDLILSTPVKTLFPNGVTDSPGRHDFQEEGHIQPNIGSMALTCSEATQPEPLVGLFLEKGSNISITAQPAFLFISKLGSLPSDGGGGGIKIT